MKTITAVRPDQLPGTTIKYKFTDRAGAEVSLYITIACIEATPFEVFINCKNAAYSEHLNTLMVMISLSLRNGVSLESIAKELCEICSPFTGHFQKGKYIDSLYAGIGTVFLNYLDKQMELIK